MTDSMCDFCELELPLGCRGFSAKEKRCPLSPRTDPIWVVGFAVYREIEGRRGIGHELAACEVDIQLEILEALGRTAIKAMQQPPKAEEKE